MHKRITFRNMEHSDVLKEYADKQLDKVIRFLGNERTPVYIDLIFEPMNHHIIALLFKLRKWCSFFQEITKLIKC